MNFNYTTGFKVFFWMLWVMGLHLFFACLIMAIFVASDPSFIIVSLSLLLASILLGITLWRTLQRFSQATHSESHLIWRLARVIIGIPFIFFAGCFAILSSMSLSH